MRWMEDIDLPFTLPSQPGNTYLVFQLLTTVRVLVQGHGDWLAGKGTPAFCNSFFKIVSCFSATMCYHSDFGQNSKILLLGQKSRKALLGCLKKIF